MCFRRFLCCLDFFSSSVYPVDPFDAGETSGPLRSYARSSSGCWTLDNLSRALFLCSIFRRRYMYFDTHSRTTESRGDRSNVFVFYRATGYLVVTVACA